MGLARAAARGRRESRKARWPEYHSRSRTSSLKGCYVPQKAGDRRLASGGRKEKAMVWYFLVALVAVLIFFIVVGAVITRRATGVLIDTRNKVSLSQFQ